MTALNGKYVIERRLGRGGMAEVFLAQTIGAEGFSRRVAVKRVLQGYSENPLFADLFVAEARLSSRLQHPNVVSVLDFDRDAEGRLFLVMELVDGADLAALSQTGLLPFPAIVAIALEVLRGLGYAHDPGLASDGVRGLVHRDVSPHNVLLSWEGAVKVSDFGIAKARAASQATATEMIKGKPAYMSPEQANGEPLDGRSDLFAVGVMLWELLCGRGLFAGQSVEETLARLLFAPIPTTRQQRPDVPADLDRVVQKLLARDRKDRYPNAEAAIAELVNCRDNPRGGRELIVSLLVERFPDRAPVRARSMGAAGSPATPLSVPTSPLPGPSRANASGPRQRRRGLVAAGLIVICVGIAVTLALAMRSHDAPSAAKSDVPAAPRPPAEPAMTTAPAPSPVTPTHTTASPKKPPAPVRPPANPGSASGIKEIQLGGG